MKFFGKLLAIGLALTVSMLDLFAQPFVNQTGAELLNVRALGTGTNGIGVTNLSLVVTNAGMVHSTNVTYTNLSGSFIRSAGAAGGTNSITTAALFKPVELWTDRNGNPSIFQIDETSFGLPTNRTTLSSLSVFVRLANPLGSNGVVGINIAPLWDGTTVPTSTAQDFGVVIPYALGAVNTMATNLPLHRWLGAKAIAIRNVTNFFTYADSTTNSPYITDITVVGFKP